MPDLLDQYLAGEKEKEPDLLDQYLVQKTEEEPTWWGAAFGPPKEYKEVYAPELGKMVPGKRVEIPLGTKIIERLKFEWESDWPQWLGLGIYLGTAGIIKARPIIGERLINKAAQKFAKNNLPALKNKFPDVFRTTRDAQVYSELALKQKLYQATADMNDLEALKTINKITKFVSKLKLPAPEAVPMLKEAVGYQAVAPSSTLLDKLVHTGLDKTAAETLAGSLIRLKGQVNKLVVGEVVDDFVNRSMRTTEDLAPISPEERAGFDEMEGVLNKKVMDVLQQTRKMDRAVIDEEQKAIYQIVGEYENIAKTKTNQELLKDIERISKEIKRSDYAPSPDVGAAWQATLEELDRRGVKIEGKTLQQRIAEGQKLYEKTRPILENEIVEEIIKLEPQIPPEIAEEAAPGLAEESISKRYLRAQAILNAEENPPETREVYIMPEEWKEELEILGKPLDAPYLPAPPEEPPTGPPITTPREKFPPEGEVPPRLGKLRFTFGSMKGALQDYERRTGFPVWTNVGQKIFQEGMKRNNFYAEYYKRMQEIQKGLSDDEIYTLTTYAKVRGAIEDIKRHLKPGQTSQKLAHYYEVMSEIEGDMIPELYEAYFQGRELYDSAFNYAGVDPEKYLQDYIPLIRPKKDLPPKGDIPVRWLGVPSKVTPFFEIARGRVGDVIYDYNYFDLMNIYIDTAGWARYRNAIADTRQAVGGLPEDAKQEVIKWMNWLQGGTGDFDKIIDQDIKAAAKWMLGDYYPEEESITQAIANQFYMGTLAFRPASALKNMTQQTHGWSETNTPWMFVGSKLYFSKEGQDIIKKSGIMQGYAPYATRAIRPPRPETGITGKVIYGQRKVLNVGMHGFSAVDHANRGVHYLAEWARHHYYGQQYINDEIDWETYEKETDIASLPKVVQPMIKGLLDDGQLDAVADMIGWEKQAASNYLYMRENRPGWMRSKVGKLAGQFLTWPTYATEFHGDRWAGAYRLSKEGRKGEGRTQLYKELKWLAMWAAIAVAGKKAGLEVWRWGIPLPTQAGPAIEGAMDAYKAFAMMSKGYTWGVSDKWEKVLGTLKIIPPAGAEIEAIRKALSKRYEHLPLEKKIMAAMGLPITWEKKPPEKEIW